MNINIALAGNPNSGKTTLFNALTGSNQFVGNWPGVTVEKKEGKLKHNKDIIITDLPGIYSLSPYSLEEIITRNYLINASADAILNIIDGTNLERNLYLTTQLLELGMPIVVAVNMMDIVHKNGDQIDLNKLSKELGCPVIEISALKNKGIKEAIQTTLLEIESNNTPTQLQFFNNQIEDTLTYIKTTVLDSTTSINKHWLAVKIFEGDEKVLNDISLNKTLLDSIDKHIVAIEEQMNDDRESIIINERYLYITSMLKSCYKKKTTNKPTTSEKIDKVVTNPIFALPIFAAIMFLVYFISVTTVGTWATDWANNGLFGEGFHLFGIGSSAAEGSNYGIWIPGIPVIAESFLTRIDCAKWLTDLIINGIIGGVGAVLGFVPQMLVLFLLLAFLEACGYMARIAFVMDSLFRKLGLSGKSFIPMLIGTGCSVPGIMASRTIENEKSRKLTIITTPFIPCSAKLPIIALIGGAMFNGVWWVAPSAYFIGILSIILSGVLLKHTPLFTNDTTPFVMELPNYHLPTISNLLHTTWERGWAFIKKAGTIILLATILIWFTSNFGWQNGSFMMVDMNDSILAALGSSISWIFKPLGWGNWQGAVATITGLIAKENVVGTFGVLLGGLEEVSENGNQIWSSMQQIFTPLSGYSFLVFNLLCAPCFAAVGAIKSEMRSLKWTVFTVGYQCTFAYIIALIVYQIGMLFNR